MLQELEAVQGKIAELKKDKERLENGFDVLDADFSPIKGPEGNIEYLIYIRKSDEPKAYKEIDIEALVELSHKTLDK